MGLREQWIRPLDALPLDYQHVIAITSSGQEEEMYLVDDKWHIVDGVRIPIEFVVFWHEKREQPTVEMAEDCVSREQAINEINKKVLCHTYEAREIIENLPSVQPQPKRGKWIDTGMWLEGRKYGKEHGEMIDAYSCEYCGYSQYYKTNFCPNCGADMREVEDER